jgi:hypothetical protein
MLRIFSQKHTPFLHIIEKWAAIIIIFLFTFPFYYAGYGIGLDASYVWGLNWLFVNDYETLKQLIYPFGPLAFIKIPTAIGYNLFISILFYSILKLGFIWLMFKLSDVMQNNNRYATIFIVFLVSFFTNIDFLIFGCCLILILLYYKKEKIIYFIISVLIAIFGLFIKLSIGTSAMSIIGILMLINLYYSKSMVQLIKQAGIIILIGFVAGMLVFGSVNTYFHFLIGGYKLTGGYGDVLSLHPNNNWLLLFPFLILMIIFPIICKEKDTRITYILSLFLLYAAWKHSFIREDIYHYSILLTFLIVFWGIIFIVSSSKKTFTFLVASVTVLLLYANMSNIPMYRGIQREITGINNFKDILDFNAFKQKMLSTSESNISKNKFNPELREIIGDATVDVYPWEFSYIAANQLKWKPRTTLEIGASTSHWASQKASENYLLDDSSPQFVVFQTNKDRHGGKFGSIDDRYLLNDEPLVIYNILNNYTLLEKTNDFLLFKRDTVSHFENIYLDEIQDYKFGEWIDIPCNTNEIIRLKVFSSNTFLGKLNKMLYKETAYFVDYQFEDGIILTYRYIPQTAVDGLWCNPFIKYPNTNEIEPKVVKVRLRNANSLLVRNSIKTQIQHVKIKSAFQNSLMADNLLFKKSINLYRKTILDFLQQSDNELSVSNGFSRLVVPDSYSYTYRIELDSLFNMVELDSLIVEANISSINYLVQPCLVISAQETMNDFWEAAYLPNSISKELNLYSYSNRLITRSEHSSGVLKVYVVNFTSSPLFIDDFRLRIKSKN